MKICCIFIHIVVYYAGAFSIRDTEEKEEEEV